MFATRLGLHGLLKEGNRLFQGNEESVYRNVDACRRLASITETSFGPNCMNKLIISHIGKHFITSDAATIVNELEVTHPSARCLILAAKMQEKEFGDGTNLVIVFGGELLKRGEELLRYGVKCGDIVKGYQIAVNKMKNMLEDDVCWKISDIHNKEELVDAIKTTLASKHLGSEAELARLVSEAAVSIMPISSQFLVDNIRVVKITGAPLQMSKVIRGMVIHRNVNGSVNYKAKCKTIILECGLELGSTEGTGTVLINTPEQMLNFTKGEEKCIETVIKEIAESGVEAIIVGGSISDIAQHYCNKYRILTIKISSKFELRRVCRTIGIPSKMSLSVPTAEEVGIVQSIEVEDISSQKVTVIKSANTKVATILLRGATDNMLDELERAIDDSVYCIRSLTQDPRFVAGGGASEIELSIKLKKYASSLLGIEQYGVTKFAEALECISRILAESMGYKANQVTAKLAAAHQKGNNHMGVCMQEDTDEEISDMSINRVYDHMVTKWRALLMATEAVNTILRVDNVIMAKPAGGPKTPSKGHWDDDE